jgi:AcrR family transcriptional regulator
MEALVPARPLTKPRKFASQERAKATVEAILAATARILVKEGYDHASTNKIAAAAGVSIGSLYQYFPSKEALVAALIEEHVVEMRKVILQNLPRLFALPLEEAIGGAVQLMIDAHRVNPKLHKVLVEQTPRTGRLERILDMEREMVDRAREFLELRRDEIAVTDVDLAAFVCVGIVEALTHTAVVSRPELLDDAYVREVTSAVVRYLRG